MEGEQGTRVSLFSFFWKIIGPIGLTAGCTSTLLCLIGLLTAELCRGEARGRLTGHGSRYREGGGRI